MHGKVTKEQIVSTIAFLEGKIKDNCVGDECSEFSFLTSPYTDELYIKFKRYFVNDKDEAAREILYVCVRPSGEVVSCSDDFKTTSDRIHFYNTMEEIKLDELKKMKF